MTINKGAGKIAAVRMFNPPLTIGCAIAEFTLINGTVRKNHFAGIGLYTGVPLSFKA